MAKKKNPESFENNMERIAEILEQVEDSTTPLDTAIALYKEGLELAKKCGETLRRYEEDVLMLQQNADKFVLQPFSENNSSEHTNELITNEFIN